MSIIRFRDLVKTSGQPEPKSLWTDPKQDRDFMKAVKANRVLTIVQSPASKKTDFGEIGFHQQPHSAYFIFPKPLPAERGKVIGIKYDLVEEPEPDDPISARDLKLPAKSNRAKVQSAEKNLPVEKTFQVQVRRMIETNISVTARTKEQAREKAIAAAKNQELDAAKEKVTARIVRVKKIS